MDVNPQRQPKPLVSVVTPVYNGAKYLAECIASVRAQSYPHWELIVLDNCSTDATPEIIERYCERDNRISVYRNTTLVDVITNHNKAFEKISPQSKYCKLLHADDWMFPDCLAEMVQIGEKHASVGVIGAYSLAGKRLRNDGLPYGCPITKGSEIARNTLMGAYYLFWSPSSLMIKSELIRERRPFFDPELLHADVDTLYSLLHQCDFGFVYKVLTFIREHEESLTATLTSSMNRLLLSNLHLFLKHAPAYLEPDEYKRHLKMKEKKYYRFLASSAFQLRGKPFWAYHLKWLANMNYHFNRHQFIKAIVRLLAERPKESLGKTVKALFQKANLSLGRLYS